MYSWPLAVDAFNYLDRIKVSLFLLNKKNRLTMGPEVKKFEKDLEMYSGANCVLTSSGSTANALLYETFIQSSDYKPEEITVFTPSTTWMSSLTPQWSRGCKIKFVDINLKDFAFNYDKLEKEVLASKSPIRVIWVTALIGFLPDIARLKKIQEKANKQNDWYSCFLFGDFCETTMGQYNGMQILSVLDMCTTSFYLAHQCTSIEGGCLFVNKDYSMANLYENSLMLRSHGLNRMLPDDCGMKQNNINYVLNKGIDPEFLFPVGGTNWRMSDVHAKFGRLDFKRAAKYEKHRREMWEYFNNGLSDKFMAFPRDMVPFCLPIIKNKRMNKDKVQIQLIKEECKDGGIETRPIIAFLPIQPFCRKYIKTNERFPNSQYLNDQGFYVGLHSQVTKRMIDKLLNIINK